MILVTFALSFIHTYCTLVKKDEHFENQKRYLGSFFFFYYYFLNVHPLSPGGFFTFLIALAHGAPGQATPGEVTPRQDTPTGRSRSCRLRPRPRLVALKNLLKVHFCNVNFDQRLILALLLILGKKGHTGKSMKNYFQTFSGLPFSNITVHAPVHNLVDTSF